MRTLLLSTILAIGLMACSDNSAPEVEEPTQSASSEMTEESIVAAIEENIEEPVVALVSDAAEVVEDAMATMDGNPTVLLETNKGNITIELWADKAPLSVENFLTYTDAGFYDGLIFHRVIPGFMVQGGGFDQDMVQKSNFEPIKNEAKSDVPNQRGTLAMARTNVVDSATSQFFINLVDNDFLNHTDETSRGFGYAVFGEVIDGMDVVDSIAEVDTGTVRGFRDVPTEAVIINSASRVN